MRRLTPWLWLAMAGVVLQLLALGSDFYKYKGENEGAWLGVPHTSDLILTSGVIAAVLVGLLAADRSPLRGRNAGLLIGGFGVLAALQVGYRTIASPFGFFPSGGSTAGIAGSSSSCYYYCAPSRASEATLLPGIWIGLAGCLAVAIGGLAYAVSRTAAATPARPARAEVQRGMNPWLGLAALGAVGQFVFGYTFFTFYTTAVKTGAINWSGWLPTPHTSSLVLAVTVAVLLLVRAAARGRSPLNPAALGGVLALLGFLAGTRILQRIFAPPFGPSADIGLGAYLAVASAALLVLAGLAQVVLHRERGLHPAGPTRLDARVSGPA